MLALALSFLAAAVLFGGGFALGYAWRGVRIKLDKLALYVTTKVVPKPVEPAPDPSVLIDPDDPVARAKYERDQIMKGLNPNE
jgi:hypothetical protein